MIKLKLSDDELTEAIGYANSRNKKEKRFGSGTYRKDMTAIKAHTIGIVAEVAISKLFGVDFDRNVYKNHGDYGVDLVLPGIGSVAIKTTTYVDEPLLRAEVKHDKEKLAAYICCSVDPSDIKTIFFVGWVYREELIASPVRKLSRYGPQNYIVEEEDLRNPEELLKIAGRN